MDIDIQAINKKHLLHVDFTYRINHGLFSRLIKYKNGIMFLEIMFTRKWTKDYDQTTKELSYCWRDANQELINSFGAKVYIMDARKHPYKKDLYVYGIKEYDVKKSFLFYDEILS